MRIFEVAVVSIVVLLILVFGVIMVEKIFQDAGAMFLFHQTTNAYAVFTFTELQLQGKVIGNGYITNPPTKTVGVGGIQRVISKDLLFFGVLPSDLPDNTEYYHLEASKAYIGFEDYGGKTEHPYGLWINYIPFVTALSNDRTTVAFGNGTLYQLFSPNSYRVTLFNIFGKGNYSYIGKPIKGIGAYTVTNKITVYRASWRPLVLYIYPQSGTLPPYISDNGVGSATISFFNLVRGIYPFNTMNSVEYLYYFPLGTNGNIVVVNSTLNEYFTLEKLEPATSGSSTDGTVKINGHDYTIVTNARSVFLFNSTAQGEVSVTIYYGNLEIEQPATLPPGTVFSQSVYVVTITPPIDPNSIQIEPVELYYEPIAVKIHTHKEHWIFTVKEGTSYKFLTINTTSP